MSRLCVCLGALLALTTQSIGNPVPPDVPSKPSYPDVEVRCVDGSMLKLQLMDPKIEFRTAYGTLWIPVTAIRKIEFATRTPSDVSVRISKAITDLADRQYKVREKATDELKQIGERAYAPALTAIHSTDAETSSRAKRVVHHLEGAYTAAQLDHRPWDVVYTADSKITGTIVTPVLLVRTNQFGDQKLDMCAAASLVSAAEKIAVQLAKTPEAPVNLTAHQNERDKEFVFKVTGPDPRAQSLGSVWGTGVYTADSNVAAAALHAGVVRPARTVVVRVKIVQSPAQFVGSAQNGVTSQNYNSSYPAAFLFLEP
ncbi:MAG: LCCL domain-containing protein [Candidatus Peregrinibacteria bacterium Gr01-1014_25]|nr:MAG: LCCL domain-containing protein [Candidatus Peregrinibacteria bacterium Gr01-1014_25]